MIIKMIAAVLPFIGMISFTTLGKSSHVVALASC